MSREYINKLVDDLGTDKIAFLDDVEDKIKSYIISQGKGCLTINQLYSNGSIYKRHRLDVRSRVIVTILGYFTGGEQIHYTLQAEHGVGGRYVFVHDWFFSSASA